MRNIIFLLLLISANELFAQGVTIYKDPRLDMLISKQVELNKVVYKENNRTGNGFRVLVINTNDRNKAMEVKSRMMTEFPDHKTYLVYQSPYFKIQVGNFRERKEADVLLKKIIRYYPTGVIVVPATVEYKAEKEEGLN
ncbi:MAG: SPOR domain-containing protein [Chitinophagaceae bacterium]